MLTRLLYIVPNTLLALSLACCAILAFNAQAQSSSVSQATNIKSTSTSTPAETSPTREPFRPSRHGFFFRNSFKGSPLPKPLQNFGIEAAVGAPDTYGKCGGMSLAAADYFFANTLIPPDTTPPSDTSPLFDYITTRQIDSLGDYAVMATKFARWMGLPDVHDSQESTAELTAYELPRLLERLNAGELVPLGLVYVSNSGTLQGKIWENHQVLAYAARQISRDDGDPAAQHSTILTTIYIYDPNFPRDDANRLTITPIVDPRSGKPPMVTTLQRTSSKRIIPVRGFFLMPYEKRDPPEALR